MLDYLNLSTYSGEQGPQGDPAGGQSGVTGGELGEITVTDGPIFHSPPFNVRIFDTANFLGSADVFSIPTQLITIPDDGNRR